MAVITRTDVFHFRATHHLDGGPAPEALHGHDYRLEVTTSDVDRARVVEVVTKHVVAVLHGRQIEIAPATGENIVEWIDQRLRDSDLRHHLRASSLRETPKNRFVSARSEARHV